MKIAWQAAPYLRQWDSWNRCNSRCSDFEKDSCTTFLWFHFDLHWLLLNELTSRNEISHQNRTDLLWNLSEVVRFLVWTRANSVNLYFFIINSYTRKLFHYANGYGLLKHCLLSLKNFPQWKYQNASLLGSLGCMATDLNNHKTIKIFLSVAEKSLKRFPGSCDKFTVGWRTPKMPTRYIKSVVKQIQCRK